MSEDDCESERRDAVACFYITYTKEIKMNMNMTMVLSGCKSQKDVIKQLFITDYI